MNSRPSIAANILLNVIRVGSGILFPILVYPYVSRVLGPENLGIVNFAISVVSYFVTLSTLGIPSYGVIACAKARGDELEFRKTVSELFFINLGLTVLSYVAFSIFLILVPKFRENAVLFLIVSLNIVSSLLGMDWVFSATENFKLITLRTLIVKVLSLVLIVLLVRNPDDSLMYALILIGATAASNVVNFCIAHRYLMFDLPSLNLRKHFRAILTYFAAVVAGTINANLDTVMLGFLHGDYSVGIYSLSVRAKNLLIQAVSAALSALVPRFSQLAEQRDYSTFRSHIRILYIWGIFLSAFFCLYCIAFSDTIVSILGGAAFSSAVVPMSILTMCVLVQALTWLLGVGVLQPLGREKEYAKVMFLATLVNVTLNSVLIPWLGVSGAAIATLITETVNAIMFHHYAKDFLGSCLRKSHVWIFILLGLASAAVSRGICNSFLSHQQAIIVLLVSFPLFCVLYCTASLTFHREFRAHLLNLIHHYKERINKNTK